MMKDHQQFKMAADKPEATNIVEFHIYSMKLQDIRYCIVTATPENMVVALEITFLPATGQKL